jgi:hypothetical protein
VDRNVITGNAVQHYRKMCSGKPAVAFCVSIKHAENVADSFRQAGYRSVAVSGKSTNEERKFALEGLRTRQLDVVCNAQLWVAGVDVPGIECIIMLRPTKSLTFYLQAIGRGLRLSAGKEYCTVLDHAGCVFEHGMPDIQREWSLEGRKKKKKTDAPAVKQCPMCFGVHEPAPVCPMCGHIYTTIQRNSPQQVDGELVEILTSAFSPGDSVEIFIKGQWSGGWTINYEVFEGTYAVKHQYHTAEQEPIWFQTKQIRADRRIALNQQASARTLAELEAIARQRGYKPGWARRVIAAREAKQQKKQVFKR